jgi:hypothetical protein
MKGYFEPLYGLAKSPVISCLTLAVFSIGLLGFGAGGCWLAARACTKLKNATVFAAAPVKFTRTGPENLNRVNVNAPPPYSRTELVKSQSVQLLPSTIRVKPLTPIFSKFLVMGGTTGTPMPTTRRGGLGGSCARVDVWMPESMKNIQQAPTINDPNASVALLITPPSDGLSNCAEWTYH